MKKLLLKTIKNVRIGSVITVFIAMEYYNGYWSRYRRHTYKVQCFTRWQIVARNTEYENEFITIRRKDLDDGYMIIVDVENLQPDQGDAAGNQK